MKKKKESNQIVRCELRDIKDIFVEYDGEKDIHQLGVSLREGREVWRTPVSETLAHTLMQHFEKPISIFFIPRVPTGINWNAVLRVNKIDYAEINDIANTRGYISYKMYVFIPRGQYWYELDFKEVLDKPALVFVVHMYFGRESIDSLIPTHAQACAITGIVDKFLKTTNAKPRR